VLGPRRQGVLRTASSKFVGEVKAKARGGKRRPTARGHQVVTYHKSWSYVSNGLKLERARYIENRPHSASPDHLANLIVR